MFTEQKRARLEQRVQITRELRAFFFERGFVEVDTPCLVPSPGMEPHLDPFSVDVHGPTGRCRQMFLHTSPEYAMKRLLADGWPQIYQLCPVFRDGEASDTHRPEFRMLEWYRANANYQALMADLEALLPRLAQALNGQTTVLRAGVEIELAAPFERLTVRQAFERHAGFDPLTSPAGNAEALAQAARAAGHRLPHPTPSWDELFYLVFLDSVEPALGAPRPTILCEYPAQMAALARLKPGDPQVAERFELYAGGLELCNAFGELVDPDEQRRRFEQERAERLAAGRVAPPIDERLLESLGRLPPSAGAAVGFDRLVMLLTGAGSLTEVVFVDPVGELAGPGDPT